jgi:hypothetical protein
MGQRYLFGLQVKQVVVTRSPRPKRRIIYDARVLRMRKIKELLCLYTVDLRKELKSEGMDITGSSLSAYLQGSVRDTEKLESLLVAMEAVFRRMHAIYGSLIDRPMVEIFDSWCAQLRIGGGARARQLATIVGHDPASLYKWYKHNRKPLPLDLLVAMQARVDAELARRAAQAPDPDSEN